ncbi:Na/Pi cotransporter family protein [Salinibius halmophilus]|uniref:Na/Pi cotransporter family protein n=1 Tax=Salinibius halmophilus TaxID=1853216 RepID=UPI000E663B88|nr:Na/Pi symporter [Salinibius halmophilus]
MKQVWQKYYHIGQVVLVLMLLALLLYSTSFAMLAAGLAVFLLGMKHIDEALRAFSGSWLENMLKASTASTFRALGFGALVTSIVQSSSLITLLSIAFVSTGMISLVGGIGVIFGANLGTTTGAWLIATLGLKVSLGLLAMPFIALGYGLQQVKAWRGVGGLLMGVAFIFLGIDFLKQGFDGLEQGIDLASLYREGWFGLVTFTLLGAVLTVVMQSSHASLLITLTALSFGKISYDAALALAIGANIGTTITAIIGASASNAAGKRLATAHVLFNVVTGVLALMLLWPMKWLVEEVAVLIGLAGDNYTLRLAIFHTLFNLLGIVIWLPFLRQLATALHKRFQTPQPQVVKSALLTSDTSLRALQQSYRKLFSLSHAAIVESLALKSKTERDADSLLEWLSDSLEEDAKKPRLKKMYRDEVKPIHSEMIEFAWQMPADMPSEIKHEQQAILQASRSLVEMVKHAKHMQKNVWKLGRSGNQTVRHCYDLLRLVVNLALLHAGRYQRGDTSLEQAEQQIIADERAILSRFEALWQQGIADGKLDGLNASSLQNDLGYCKALLQSLRFAMMERSGASPVDDHNEPELAATPE